MKGIKSNSQKPLNITSELLKDIDSLIKILESSLELQKQFLKDIDNKLSSFLKNKGKNQKEDSLFEELISLLPKIISQLGIPFVYYFPIKENIEKFAILYYDKYTEQVAEIFEACLNILRFSLYYDSFNELKQNLIDIGIIQNKEEYNNKISNMNPEQIIFERISSQLNKLTQLKNIGKDKENISQFQKEYNDLLNEIQNLNKIEITLAKIEFYQELIKPLGDYLRTNNKNIINKEEKLNDIKINSGNDNNNNNNKQIEPIKGIPLDQRTFFYMDEKIKENRNQFIEFKYFSFPIKHRNREEIKRQLCGFLNSEGGRLYIGINDSNIVKGIDLNYKNRDVLRNDLVNLTYDFYPKCRLDKILLYFIPIKEENTQKFIPKKYIIKIRVLPGDPQFLYSMTNKRGYHSTIRRNGKCINLNSIEIYDEIIHRDENKNFMDNEKYQIILKEIDIKDPEPEINQQDLENDINEDETPIFGNNNFKKTNSDKGKKTQKKHKEKAKKDDTKEMQNYQNNKMIIIKVTNIDENLKLNDINRTFNLCKRTKQKFTKKGYGYLYFTSKNNADYCLANYSGLRLGNKIIELNIVDKE